MPVWKSRRKLFGKVTFLMSPIWTQQWMLYRNLNQSAFQVFSAAFFQFRTVNEILWKWIGNWKHYLSVYLLNFWLDAFGNIQSDVQITEWYFWLNNIKKTTDTQTKNPTTTHLCILVYVPGFFKCSKIHRHLILQCKLWILSSSEEREGEWYNFWGYLAWDIPW